jgi:hypothetical protein
MPYVSVNPYEGETAILFGGPVGFQQLLPEKLVRSSSFEGPSTIAPRVLAGSAT